VDFITKYDLDGLDIDWEYPGLKGDDNRFRPEDKENYTLLLKELRLRFNREGPPPPSAPLHLDRHRESEEELPRTYRDGQGAALRRLHQPHDLRHVRR